MQCSGFKPFCCSVCGFQSPVESRLRSVHMAVEHPGDTEATVQVCGPKAEVEAAIRATVDNFFPFHPSIALSWPGLDPHTRLEEVLGVEAHFPVEVPLPLNVKLLYDAPEQDFDNHFREDELTEDERNELQKREKAPAQYLKRRRPTVHVMPASKRTETCLVCERKNHILAPRDGRPTATAVIRHATICGGFRPFLCSLCDFANPVRYEVKCHIKKMHGGNPDALMVIHPDSKAMAVAIRAHALKCFPQFANTIKAWKGIRPDNVDTNYDNWKQLKESVKNESV